MRLKFLIPVLGLVVLFTVAAVVWVPWQMGNLLSDELSRRGKLAAETLDKSSIGALVVQDQGALNQLAKGFIRSNEILFVLILDKEGRNLADSGIEPRNFSAIESRLPQLQKTEADFVSSDKWPSSGESFFMIARPVFYEQLRIGTVALGISGSQGRAVDLAAADADGSSVRRNSWSGHCSRYSCGEIDLTAARGNCGRNEQPAEPAT